ncbi:hypothetical protein DP091_14130 [Paenibacillus sp. MDMC362]|nr:hypothetical protein DP091_14130 [Paenibacillus sp. MDMC362]
MFQMIFIIFIMTALVSIAHILFDLGSQSGGYNWLVKVSNLLFWASLLLLIVRKKNRDKE